MNKFKKLLSSAMATVMVLSAAPLGEFAGIDLPDFSGIKAFAAEENPISGTFVENLTWAFDEETETLTIGADVSNCDFIEEIIRNSKTIKTIRLDEGNKYFKLVDGVLYDADVETLLIYPTASDKKEYIMPDSVKNIFSADGICYSPFSAKNLETLKIGANFLVETYQEALTLAEEEANLFFMNEFYELPSPDSESGKILFTTMVGVLLPQFMPQFSSLYYSDKVVIADFSVSESNPLFFSKNGILYLRYNGYDMLIRQVVNHLDTVKLDANTIMYNHMPFVNSKIDKFIITDEFTENRMNYLKLYFILSGYEEGSEEYEYYIKSMGTRTLTGCFLGSFIKEIKVSDTNNYFCTEDGILYSKDKSVLAFFPMGTDKTFVEIPEVEYVSYYAFNTQAMLREQDYVNNSELTLHIPDCFLDGTTKSLESGYPVTEEGFIELLGLTVDKICIENEDSFISCYGMTVEQWNEKTEVEYERFSNEFNAYIEAYENGEISKSEFIEHQEIYDEFVKSIYFYEICGGKHNFVEEFTIDEVENTEVKYGETLTLTANLGEAGLPESCRVEWTVEGTGAEIVVSEDTLTCEVKCVDSGEVTVTAKVVDAAGNTVTNENGNNAEDSQTLTMNAGFFQRVVAFFNHLWNLIVSLFK